MERGYFRIEKKEEEWNMYWPSFCQCDKTPEI